MRTTRPERRSLTVSAAGRTKSTEAERHRHRWEVVAIEEDAFGRIAMRQCDCGIHHFMTAA